MTTDAVNDGGELVYVYPPLTVYISEDSDKPVTVSGAGEGDASEADGKQPDVVRGVVCGRVRQTAGGSELDSASLTFTLDGSLTDRTQPGDFTRMVQVDLPEPSGEPLHLGDYVKEAEQVTADGESLTAESRLQAYFFGIRPRGPKVWNPITQSSQVIDGPIEFNPKTDDRNRDNRSDKRFDANDDSTPFLWFDARCSRTEAARNYHEQEASAWTLAEAVASICELCNPDEEFINNPSATDYSIFNGAQTPQGISLPPGLTLPEYLDQLLQPLGYNWFVNVFRVGNITSHTIKLFKQHSGTEKTVKLQAPGEQLDLDESNVSEYSVTRDIGNAVNAVEVLGAYERVELTLPLYRDWAEEDDSLSVSDLDSSDPASQYSVNGKNKVWRRFVANEGGDYTGNRTTVDPILEPPDLSDVFQLGDYLPRRRVAGDCLTHYDGIDADVAPDRFPPLIEFSTDAGDSWDPLPAEAGDVLLLPDQVGIHFAVSGPAPSLLRDAGDDLRLRITCTIEGDYRVRGYAERVDAAVNGRTIPLSITRPNKYRFDHRADTGEFESRFESNDYTAFDEQDDRESIQSFAESLRADYQAAEMQCEFTLPGYHIEYEIGDVITSIEGREISLNMASPETGARYPQVVGRTWIVDKRGPRTVLTLDRGVRRR